VYIETYFFLARKYYHLGHRNKNMMYNNILYTIYAMKFIVRKNTALKLLPFNSKSYHLMVQIRGNEFFQKKIMQQKNE
jgi:hypothetical protein